MLLIVIGRVYPSYLLDVVEDFTFNFGYKWGDCEYTTIIEKSDYVLT